jgi:pyruvate carboxylase
VQRRHQKVVEIAPSVGLDDRVRHELCDAAARIAKEIGYDNAGTIEFLLDLDKNEWFFIEMNPRIQVEHTVTEQITGLDLVRSQILVAQGAELHGPVLALPQQDAVPRLGLRGAGARHDRRSGEQVHAELRQDPHLPRAEGFGIRLDAGMGDAGAVITPFYDSLLVKITATGQTFEMALQRMDRACGSSASAA